MCDHPGSAHEVATARPRPADGPAVDPITLHPVDEVSVTVLMDNVVDAFLEGDETTDRPFFGAPTAPAPQLDGGLTRLGLRAEHGFSALVRVRRGTTTTTLLFDAGVSPDGVVDNADRLGIDLTDIGGVVLSHGHFDHTGGLAGLAARRRGGLPVTVHPAAFTRRRFGRPDVAPIDIPTLSRRALAGEGFEVIERREPSLLVDGSVLVTGEVDRTTEFEHGMPPSHEAWDVRGWHHDPLVRDDQALVVHLRGQGLVVLTGCGHAGAVNIVRHAQRLTGVPRLHALFGGMHLSGSFFAPSITPTSAAFTALAPALLVPGHCTGWRAQHRLAAALPEAWAPSSSGSTFRLAAA